MATAGMTPGVYPQLDIHRRVPNRYPTFDQCREWESHTLHVTDPAMELHKRARAICYDLIGKNIPAADLNDEQKCAIYTVHGFMKYEDGKMISIRPVAIADDGKGGYIVGIAPA